MRKCKHCANEFEHKDKRALFCSKKCSYTHFNKLQFTNIAEAKRGVIVTDLDNEEWRDVVGYEGYYQVSNFARIKRLFNQFNVIRGESVVRMSNPEYILNGNINKWGYHKVILRKEGKGKPYLVHRLVAQSFIPNPNNYETINHIDCNKLNNSIDNLEWCSRNRNTKHAWENGLYSNFTYKNVICTETNKEWQSVKAAATELGIRPQALARMLRGDRRNNTTLIYKPNKRPSTETEQ